MKPVRVKVSCPACRCNVSSQIMDAACLQASKRLNRQSVMRVAKLLVDAEAALKDSRVQSAGQLWRADVRAIRYVFNRLVSAHPSLAKPSGTP